MEATRRSVLEFQTQNTLAVSKMTRALKWKKREKKKLESRMSEKQKRVDELKEQMRGYDVVLKSFQSAVEDSKKNRESKIEKTRNTSANARAFDIRQKQAKFGAQLRREQWQITKMAKEQNTLQEEIDDLIKDRELSEGTAIIMEETLKKLKAVKSLRKGKENVGDQEKQLLP